MKNKFFLYSPMFLIVLLFIVSCGPDLVLEEKFVDNRNSWELNNEININNNLLKMTPTKTSQITWPSYSLKNGKVSVTSFYINGDKKYFHGIAFDIKDRYNNKVFLVANKIALLGEIINNTAKIVKSKKCSNLKAGDEITLTIELDDDTVTGYVNDKEVITHEFSKRDQGGVGLVSKKQTQIAYKDFQIWSSKPLTKIERKEIEYRNFDDTPVIVTGKVIRKGEVVPDIEVRAAWIVDLNELKVAERNKTKTDSSGNFKLSMDRNKMYMLEAGDGKTLRGGRIIDTQFAEDVDNIEIVIEN